MSGGVRVLVIDDDADMQVLMSALLDHLGAQTTSAGDIASVLSALAAPFDLILLDLVMPPGVFEGAVDALVTHAPATPIALLSGSDRHTLDQSRLALQARGLRVEAALVKPVRLDALAGLLAAQAARTG
jgi:CheY-like chemotaxis protein